MMANVPRPISFIAAAVSCRRTFVGPLIKATGAIPVERPQDIAYKGKGKIVKVEGNRVFG
jgi:glycerol-3-phosphate O-acyltransferase/dihydroxyacetone phosphate acyltransferase